MRNTNRFAFLPRQRELQRTPLIPSRPSNREEYAVEIRKAYQLPTRQANHMNEERLLGMKMPELQMIAREHGHKYRVGMSKQDLIDLIIGRIATAPEVDHSDNPGQSGEPDNEKIVVE